MLSEWILGGTAIPLRGMDPKIEILVLWKFSSKFQLMFQFHLVLYVNQVVRYMFSLVLEHFLLFSSITRILLPYIILFTALCLYMFYLVDL